MSSEGTPDTEAQPALPNLTVVAQYIKDLSFENPGAPGGLTQRPQIELGVDLAARRGDAEHFEVEMKMRVTARAEDKTLFLLELSYGGLFRLQNIPDEAIQQVLLIQAPHMMFPFARRIVSDVVRDGGMPPLMIEPIDFVSLYQAKMAQAAQQAAQGGQPANGSLDLETSFSAGVGPDIN
jgi:preprotein translocase subunit SecB